MHVNSFSGMLAQANAPAPSGTQGTPASPMQGLLGQLPFFILIFVIFYFILIRPQQQRAKQQAKLLAALKSGDRVVTAAGLIGTVITVKEKSVSIRSADAKFEVTKASVTEILADDSTPTTAS